MFNKQDRILLEELYATVYALKVQVENMRLDLSKMSEQPKVVEEKSPFMNEDGLYSFKEYAKKSNARKYGNMKEVVE